MKRYFIAACAASLLLSCAPKKQGRIYFFDDIVTGTNIVSVDLDGNRTEHTAGRGSREIDMAVADDGTVIYSSNLVLAEDRAARQNKKKGQSRRQDFNVYLRPSSVAGEEATVELIGKSEMPETQAGISPDGQWMSFVRTVLASGPDQKNVEELYVVKRGSDELLKVASADAIIRPHWSPKGGQLVYSTYAFAEKYGTVAIYRTDTARSELILENPWENSQIDSPQWSPDGKKLSLIQHPLYKDGVRRLYVYDFVRKKLEPVSGDNVVVQAPVSWASDGRSIVYGGMVDYKSGWEESRRQRIAEGSGQIFLADLKSGTTQLTQGDQQRHLSPVFSPNDKLIAYLYSPDLTSKRLSLRVIDRKGKLVKDNLHEKVSGISFLIWR